MNRDINIKQTRINCFRQSKVDGEFMLQMRVPGGFVDAKYLSTVQHIAQTWGDGNFHFGTRQTFDVCGIKYDDIPAVNEYIESYLSSYPGVRDYLKNVVKTAYEDGYVTTPLGRRRYIPELAGQNKNLKSFGERVAMNSPIQGSAADIIKIAMVNVGRKLREMNVDARLILQVHDELLIEAHRDVADEVAKMLQNEMENAVSLNVPLVAEVTRGENWFDNK